TVLVHLPELPLQPRRPLAVVLPQLADEPGDHLAHPPDEPVGLFELLGLLADAPPLLDVLRLQPPELLVEPGEAPLRPPVHGRGEVHEHAALDAPPPLVGDVGATERRRRRGYVGQHLHFGSPRETAAPPLPAPGTVGAPLRVRAVPGWLLLRSYSTPTQL